MLSVRSPQEWPSPESIAVKVPDGGEDCPTALRPQHDNVLWMRTPQVKLDPAVIASNSPGGGSISAA